jgi:murein DD-endopeptidase MepM/ murein hydrolase activator NlpD
MAFFLERQISSEPVPQIVRSLPTRRANRLRVSWFVLGTLFGTAVAYSLFLALHHFDEYASRTRKLQLAAHSTEAPSGGVLILASKPAPAAIPVQKPAVVQSLPASMNLAVHRGDTLTSMLMDKGVAYQEACNVVDSMKKIFNPKHLTVGQSVELHLDKNRNSSGKPSVSGLSIPVSAQRTIAISRAADDTFAVREIRARVFKDVARGGGEIRSSLYQTGVDSGVPPQLLSEIIHALSYDVDFQRDIKEGDRLDVVYERMRTDRNITTGYGKVIYASLTLGDKQLALYRHISPDGYSGYYNAKGESVRKALLKTPINGAHITSSFGMRMHPLLGYSKMHKGIDFGALTGTPIYAAGEGVIVEAGRKGGYGNYVRLKHNANYETAYGHASRIARGMHPGVHVKQGQVIAYVGSTGISTGPHLHYEILVNGSQVNPSGVRFRTGQTLAGRELIQFRREVRQVEATLAALPQKTQVAQLVR